MSDAIIGALLLNFTTMVAVNIVRIGRQNCSPVTYELATPLIPIGYSVIPFSIFLFVREEGPIGIFHWVASTVPIAIIIVLLMDGLRSILEIVTLVIGGYFAVRSFF